MQTWEAFAIVGTTIVAIIAVWSAIQKIIIPALKTRDKFKKVDGIDEIQEETHSLKRRVDRLEGYQDKNYESICRIESNVDLIGRGVLSLINNRLTGNAMEDLQAVKNEIEARRAFK